MIVAPDINIQTYLLINVIFTCLIVRWLINLENTKWLQYISGLLKASLLVVNAIDKDRKSVLVHCSDGWDRTPQIVALAELLLDPYYRTVEVRLTVLLVSFIVVLIIQVGSKK